MTEQQPTIMQRLKSETNDLHSRAESRPLQRAIATGEIDRGSFTDYLGQLYHVHRVLESTLEENHDRHPKIAELATADRMRVPDLDRDFEFFGLDREHIPAGEAAQRFAAKVSETVDTNPVGLLGALYVLEGSTNGGRFLARALRKSWDLADEGLAYFDPYGDQQPRLWAEFKESMDRGSFGARDQEAMIEMAKTTFLAISEVSDEVAKRSH